MKALTLFLSFFILNNLNIYGQDYFNKKYKTYFSIGMICAEYEIEFYKDSTFICVLPNHITSGYYSSINDTIKLTTIKNDTNVNIIDAYSMQFKNKNYWPHQWHFGRYDKLKKTNLTGTVFVKQKDLLIRVKSKFSDFPNELRSTKPNKKVIIQANYSFPKSKYCNVSEIDTSDILMINQIYKTKNILQKEVTDSKQFTVFDIDSSLLVIAPKKMFFYFTNDTLLITDFVFSSTFMFKFKRTPLQYYTVGLHNSKTRIVYGWPLELDKLISKSYTQDSHKKCTRQLLNSDYFNHKKVSFSNYLKINCNENTFNYSKLIFGLGYKYLFQMLEDYNNSEKYVKIKKNADYYISKPAFTKNKIYALMKIKDEINNKEEYLLFERRLKKYQLIATINENGIIKNNVSEFFFRKHYQNNHFIKVGQQY